MSNSVRSTASSTNKSVLDTTSTNVTRHHRIIAAYRHHEKLVAAPSGSAASSTRGRSNHLSDSADSIHLGTSDDSCFVPQKCVSAHHLRQKMGPDPFCVNVRPESTQPKVKFSARKPTRSVKKEQKTQSWFEYCCGCFVSEKNDPLQNDGFTVKSKRSKRAKSQKEIMISNAKFLSDGFLSEESPLISGKHDHRGYASAMQVPYLACI
jgi:hypothetical protein